MHQRRPLPPRTPPPPRRTSCLGNLLVLAVLLLAGGIGYMLLLRPGLSASLGSKAAQYATRVQPAAPAAPYSPDQMQEPLATAVAALPRGEIVVSEAQANALLAADPQALKPLDDVYVTFAADEVQVTMSVAGNQSRAAFGLAAQEGRIALVQPRLSGPLALLISIDDLTRTLEQQFNSELVAQGRSVQSVRVEPGQAIIVIQ